MDIGSICICVTVGALICFIFTGIGVCFGRSDKESHDRDSDVNIYIPMRYRDRGGNKRDSPPDAREITDVLYILRIGASSREKRVIDYLIDREEKE